MTNDGTRGKCDSTVPSNGVPMEKPAYQPSLRPRPLWAQSGEVTHVRAPAMLEIVLSERAALQPCKAVSPGMGKDKQVGYISLIWQPLPQRFGYVFSWGSLRNAKCDILTVVTLSGSARYNSAVKVRLNVRTWAMQLQSFMPEVRNLRPA